MDNISREGIRISPDTALIIALTLQEQYLRNVLLQKKRRNLVH